MSGKDKKAKVKGPVKSVSSLSAKKQRCAASWGKGQARKQLRREEAEAAASRNRGLRARGELTPWERAKAAARARKRGSNISSKGTDVTRQPTAREAVRAAKRGAGSGD
jgi:hypothetical protein